MVELRAAAAVLVRQRGTAAGPAPRRPAGGGAAGASATAASGAAAAGRVARQRHTAAAPASDTLVSAQSQSNSDVQKIPAQRLYSSILHEFYYCQ